MATLKVTVVCNDIVADLLVRGIIESNEITLIPDALYPGYKVVLAAVERVKEGTEE